MTVRDSGGNVQVDFVWGNFPLQPNDDRGSATLNPALDNHSIATTGWANFPSFLPNYAGDGDTGLEVAVPKITGALEATALTRLTAAGLTATAGAVTTEGATSANEGKVATQTPAAGTVVNAGSAVTYSLYSLAPAAIIAPTNDWTYNWMNGRFVFNGVTQLPMDINGSAAYNKKLVITGGSWAGEYLLSNGALDGTVYVQVQGGFPAGSMGVEGSVDGGLASVVA